MPESERIEESTHPAAAAYKAALEAVQVDLGVVLRQHAPLNGWPLCVHALVETCGTLARCS